MSQQSRQAPASSSNNPESSHEPKGPVGTPRNDHWVSTETREDPLWWNAQPVGFITTRLRIKHGMGRTTFSTFHTKRGPRQTINKKHYLKELFSYSANLNN